ncbi:hypothetical protein HELRODRAFT_62698, partial [Helobdella robusta]|uniref:CBS domain-containing protein n=1 Tax=Helobdella robusta TaxID=6412 RepID=T1FX38_HELRO
PPSASYARFLRDHTCYDLMPPSSKIVVFDMRLSVKRSFLALVGNGVKAAVLWDTELQDFTSMLTITDFIKILYRYHRAGEIGVEDVENDTICKWKSVFNSSNLISCCPEDSLFTALKLLCQNRVHRLLVIDSKLGNPINILTHKRILKFIHLHMKTIPEPDFMNSPISSIQTATTKNVSTITYSTRLINVLRLFIEHHISAVPVVDERGKLIDKLAYDKLYSDLGRPVREIMSKQKSEVSLVCWFGDTLKTVVDRIVTASVHRLIIVNDDEEVVGVLTLSDLLRHLVLIPIGLLVVWSVGRSVCWLVGLLVGHLAG